MRVTINTEELREDEFKYYFIRQAEKTKKSERTRKDVQILFNGLKARTIAI